MKKYICDIEGNGLLDTITKIHCVGYAETSTGLVYSTSSQEQIKDFFLQEDIILIMHNGILFDKKAIEKVLGIKIKCKIWDSLAISWVISPNRQTHNLADYGVEFGVPKPIVEDWDNQPISVYMNRVEEDVKINYKLWIQQAKYLNELYEENHEQIIKFLDYLSFKLDCVAEHQEIGVNFNKKLAEKSLQELEIIKEEKINNLKGGMPKKPIKNIKFPPRIMYKKDGSPSSNRLKWLEFLKEHNLPQDYNQEVEYIASYEEPNPNSHIQIKDWLFSLGWNPDYYKYVREDGKKEMKKIPQIMSKEGNGEVCQSVKVLIEKEPVLENLDNLSIISHRISIFKGFLRDCKNGRLYQNLQGLTNTLRLQHKTIVNLPLPSKPFSENIRKCLIADEGKIMIGCDLKNIESMTKNHYIYDFDPEYVKTLMNPEYDSHLELGVLGKFITEDQEKFYKWFSSKK